MISLTTLPSRPIYARIPASPDSIEEIGQIGMEHAPLEACGIVIIGQGVKVIQNYSTDPENSSIMRADDVLDAVIGLSASDLKIHDKLIFWHTHPGNQYGPSSIDLAAREAQPGIRMMVVSIPSGRAVEY